MTAYECEEIKLSQTFLSPGSNQQRGCIWR